MINNVLNEDIKFERNILLVYFYYLVKHLEISDNLSTNVYEFNIYWIKHVTVNVRAYLNYLEVGIFSIINNSLL